jgi:hypothetical protein
MYGKMKKKDGGSVSEGMMEDYTSVPPELSATEQSKKKKDTSKSKTIKKAKGGKIGRGCGSAIRGAGKVMKA